MASTNSAHLFHMCIQLKYDIGHFSSLFVKPNCLCFSLTHQLNEFWVECDNALNKMNSLVSMVLQMLCETSECLCLENMHPILDSMHKCLQSLLMVLSDNHQYLELGMINTLVESDGLVLYLASCTDFAHKTMHQLNDILKHCDFNHCNLLSKYSACVLCCK